MQAGVDLRKPPKRIPNAKSLANRVLDEVLDGLLNSGSRMPPKWIDYVGFVEFVSVR